jgi:hypothetical protein
METNLLYLQVRYSELSVRAIMGNCGRNGQRHEVQKAAIGPSRRMDYHSNKLYESSSEYYQLIIGTASKYDVHKRLVAKGYVMYKKGDDSVD